MKMWSLTAILVMGAAFLLVPACSNNDGAGDGDMGGNAGDGDGDDSGGASGDGDGDSGGSVGDGDGDMGGQAQGGQGGIPLMPGDSTAECISYCDLWFTKECDQVMQVTTMYGDEDTCLEVCADFSHEGTDGSLKGDTVQCRIEQLELATVQGVRCTNAEETPKAQCTGDPQ